MSRDPLEELFGPLDSDDAETGAIETDEIRAASSANTTPTTRAFEPAPAVRPRAEHDPAAAPTAPVAAPTAATRAAAAPTAPITPAPRAAAAPRAARAQRDETPTQPVAAPRKNSSGALPWIIVAAVAVLALVGSLIAVNALRSDEPKPAPTSEAPAPTPTETDTETEEPEPTPEEPAEPEVPKVDVGADPISMPVSFAGISIETSQKLTSPQWQYIAGPPERVMIESGLMNTFPEACSAMRSPSLQSPWGIEKAEDGTWTVVRPEGTCAANPDLYNEVWGLMQAVADSAKPL